LSLLQVNSSRANPRPAKAHRASNLTACVATPRPITPAYPVISQQFSQAFLNAYMGADAQAEFDKAAKAIDQDYEDNNGYTN